MSEVINMAGRKTKSRDRQSIEIGKLTDLDKSHQRISKKVLNFNGFKLTGGPGSGSTAAIDACTKMREGMQLMRAGLDELQASARAGEPGASSSVVLDDAHAEYAALLKACRNANREFGRATVNFLQFLSGMAVTDPTFGDGTNVAVAGEHLCEALEVIGASLNALWVAEDHLFTSTTSET
ncbi:MULTISPECIES: hypothetical protein [unclassified Rhizobium]|uniref:hypothetical protein n=1 Tax=unclassified Rhizobium TaxID=2613769 RepID=UPI0007EB1B5C|nr:MULTISPECIES: hypothetical protein [unclassified Rhizobium]ANL12032.1 hypothetical protein AMJ98_PA00086 [Rhizobium sp. N1341]ANM42877.1 hypothetical protein AMK03_PA00086 [Rhizobium sp. N741]